MLYICIIINSKQQLKSINHQKIIKMKKPFIKDKSLSFFSSYNVIIKEGSIKKDIRREYKINGVKIEMFFWSHIKGSILFQIYGCGKHINNQRHKTFPLIKRILEENNISYIKICCHDSTKPEYSYTEKLELNEKKGKQKHLY